MRPLEIAIAILIFASLIEPLIRWHNKPRWFAFVPSAALLAVIAQILLEGYRWQMVPLYLFAVILFVLSFRRITRASETTPLREPELNCKYAKDAKFHKDFLRALRVFAVKFVPATLGVLLLIVASALPVLFPVIEMPAPNGEYQVGTVTYDWVDNSRDEIYSGKSGDKRELMVQIWYPASPPANATPALWMDRIDIVGPAISRYLHLPDFFLDHLKFARSNSYTDAPASNRAARYPVVVYSHGWNGFRAVNANQMEALASHGYIAVGMDHTYGAMFTLFPDGRIALNNPNALVGKNPSPEFQRSSEILEATYAADVRFVIDQLALLDAGKVSSPLAGKFDLNRVGLFGHSTGGGAIVLACSRDPRCKAGLGMDAWVEPIPASVVPQAPSQPFMFMRSETWATASKRCAPRGVVQWAAQRRLSPDDSRNWALRFHSPAVADAACAVPQTQRTVGWATRCEHHNRLSARVFRQASQTASRSFAGWRIAVVS